MRVPYGCRYQEQHVSVARTATLGENVCIGAATTVGDNTTVVQSVIGRNCRIGKNVRMVGCYILDDVTIQVSTVPPLLHMPAIRQA